MGERVGGRATRDFLDARHHQSQGPLPCDADAFSRPSVCSSFPPSRPARPSRPTLPRARPLPDKQDNVPDHGFPVGGTKLYGTKGMVCRNDNRVLTSGMVIQVSAAINPGNSGGPAVANNKLIGLVCSRLSDAE